MMNKKYKYKFHCFYCGRLRYTNKKKKKFCDRYCNFKYNKKKAKELKEGKRNELLFLNGKTSNLLRLRFEVFKRDKFTCRYCGRSVEKNRIEIVIDHVKPKSKGGEDTYENLVTSCVDCNLGKSDILLEVRDKERAIKKKSFMRDKCIKCGKRIEGASYKWDEGSICGSCLDEELEG